MSRGLSFPLSTIHTVPTFGLRPDGVSIRPITIYLMPCGDSTNSMTGKEPARVCRAFSERLPLLGSEAEPKKDFCLSAVVGMSRIQKVIRDLLPINNGKKCVW